MNEDLLPELFKQPNADFLQHLTIENNERIIFSGKFGHGKTTFINNFFNEETQKKNYSGNMKYNVISLYPVNYSIASNEDIFKYIKYDIILDMLNRKYDVKKSAVSYFKTLPAFIKKNLHKVLASLVYMIPNVGKDVVESFEKLDKLKNEFLKYHDKENENGSDLLADYLDKLETSEGNIFEDDVITKLISQILHKKKDELGSDVENVLVIDDLDRIDPEHIFRILNVFAAHFDRRNLLRSKNKFGFDKIILVCDIENIRNIFRAKYGTSTDFNGYIDKYYSTRVFHFSNKGNIVPIAKSIFWNIKWKHNEYYGHNDDELRKIRQGEFFKLEELGFFIDMIDLLFSSGQIDLRNVVKMKTLPITYTPNAILIGKYYEEQKYKILFYLRLLALIKGDYHSLIEAFKNTSKNILNTNKLKEYSKEIVYILVSCKRGEALRTGFYPFILDGKRIGLEVKIEGNIANPKLQLHEGQHETSGILNITDDSFVWLIEYTINFLASQGHFNH